MKSHNKRLQNTANTYVELTQREHDLLLKIVESSSARVLKDQLKIYTPDEFASYEEPSVSEIQVLIYNLYNQLTYNFKKSTG